MIDIQQEHLLTLAQATKCLPKRRRRKRPSPSTLYRWAGQGLRGIRLETIAIGGTTCTSKEALQRFFEQLTALDDRGFRPETRRSPRDQHVEELLDREGI